MRGIFITIEGPDGVGKTTLINRLGKMISNSYITREPSDLDTGKEIRRVLSSKDPKEQNKLYDLYLKDRANHLKTQIKPALQAGKIVLCDRYYHSSIVYQSLQGVDVNKIIKSNSKFIAPDLAIIVTDTYENLHERINNRISKDKEFLEEDDFLRNSIDIYNDMNNLLPNDNIQYVTFDPDNNLQNVYNKICYYLQGNEKVQMITPVSEVKYPMITGSALGRMVGATSTRNLRKSKMNIMNFGDVHMAGDSFVNGMLGMLMKYIESGYDINFMGKEKVVNAFLSKIGEDKNNVRKK